MAEPIVLHASCAYAPWRPRAIAAAIRFGQKTRLSSTKSKRPLASGPLHTHTRRDSLRETIPENLARAEEFLRHEAFQLLEQFIMHAQFRLPLSTVDRGDSRVSIAAER